MMGSIQVFSVLLFVFYFVSLSLSETGQRNYDSNVRMVKLLDVEEDFIETANDYLAREKIRLNDLEQFVKKQSQKLATARKDPVKYLSSPFNAFLLIKKLYDGWTSVGQTNLHNSKLNHEDSFRAFALEMAENRTNMDDMIGSTTALDYIVGTYNLSSDDIAEGYINKRKAHDRLTDRELYWVAGAFYERRDLYNANKFLETLYLRLNDSDVSEMDEKDIDLRYMELVSPLHVMDLHAWTHYMRGNLMEAKKLSQYIIEKSDEFEHVERNVGHYTELITIQAGKKQPYSNMPFYRQNYTTTVGDRKILDNLCNGIREDDPEHDRRLRCFVRDFNLPRMLLKPAKIEVLHYHPLVVMYYNVTSDTEAAKLAEAAKEPLINSYKLLREQWVDRVWSGGWYYSDDEPIIDEINTRIADYTGFNTNSKSAEPLLIKNYGLSGINEPQYDHANTGRQQYLASEGRRMSTFHLFLSDVDGGAMIFPEVNVHIPNTKNAGVYYRNYLNETIIDFRVMRAECPVTYGNKWTATKYLMISNSQLPMKCGLNPPKATLREMEKAKKMAADKKKSNKLKDDMAIKKEDEIPKDSDEPVKRKTATKTKSQ